MYIAVCFMFNRLMLTVALLKLNVYGQLLTHKNPHKHTHTPCSLLNVPPTFLANLASIPSVIQTPHATFENFKNLLPNADLGLAVGVGCAKMANLRGGVLKVAKNQLFPLWFLPGVCFCEMTNCRGGGLKMAKKSTRRRVFLDFDVGGLLG